MKSLTLEQYVEIVKFSQKYHAFASYKTEEEGKEISKLYPKLDRFGFGIKYIDSCYDSRGEGYDYPNDQGSIWSITFRQGRWGIRFSCNHFQTIINPEPKQWKYDNLYDLCMDYLKGEFIPKEEFQIDMED